MISEPSSRAELAKLLSERIGQDFDGECHLAEHEARQIISALTAPLSADSLEPWLSHSRGCASYTMSAKGPLDCNCGLDEALTASRGAGEPPARQPALVTDQLMTPPLAPTNEASSDA